MACSFLVSFIVRDQITKILLATRQEEKEEGESFPDLSGTLHMYKIYYAFGTLVRTQLYSNSHPLSSIDVISANILDILSPRIKSLKNLSSLPSFSRNCLHPSI